MNQRQDALLAAAKFIEAVNRTVNTVAGRQVGTVGRIQALPGAPNVIPGKVVLSLELRDLDASKIKCSTRRFTSRRKKSRAQASPSSSFKEINVNLPAPTDSRIRKIIADSASELGLTTRLMPSGAGHNAQDMALLGPVGMILFPASPA